MILHLRAAVEQLYAVTPPEFTPLRTRLAKEAKGAGEVTLAASVTALRKPTVAAWAVNHFVREHGDRLDDLRAFAELLREAQRTLDADQLRTLGRERATRVDAVAEQVGQEARAAGHPLGAGVAQEVRDTLTALVSDEAAEASVLTGALVRSLAYSGFGSVDIEDVVAIDDTDVEPGGRAVRRGRPALAVLQGGRADPDRGAGSATAGAGETDFASGPAEDKESAPSGAATPVETDEEAAAQAAAAEAAAQAAAQAAAVAAERTRLTARLDRSREALRSADRQVAVLGARQEEVHEGIADLERRLATARTRLEKVTAELADADGIRDGAQRQHDDLAAALAQLDAGRPGG